MNHQVTNMAYCLSLSSLIHEKRENLNDSLQKKISPKKHQKPFLQKRLQEINSILLIGCLIVIFIRKLKNNVFLNIFLT